jgi:hypothetical protein
MIALSLDETKAKKMEVLEELAIDKIISTLKGEGKADEDEVKLAIKSLGIVAKNRQTSTNRASMEFKLAMSIATPEQLRQYITVTYPQIRKAISGKTDEKVVS